MIILDDVRATHETREAVSAALARLVREAKGRKVKLVLTCQTNVWNLFRLGIELAPADVFIPNRVATAPRTWSLALGEFTADEQGEAIRRRVSGASGERLARDLLQPTFAPLRHPDLLGRYLDRHGREPVAVPVEVTRLLDESVDAHVGFAATQVGTDDESVRTGLGAMARRLWVGRRGDVTSAELVRLLEEHAPGHGSQILSRFRRRGLVTVQQPTGWADEALGTHLSARHLLTCLAGGGETLGDLDPDTTVCEAVKHELLPVLTSIQQDLGEGAPTTFLSGYLASLHESDSGQWQAVMLSLANTPVIRKQFPDFVIASGMSEPVARKIVELCRSGACDLNRLERFWFSQRLQQIEESVFLQLIDLQLADGRAGLWNNAIHMFHTYYLGVGVERPVPEQPTFRSLTGFDCDGESGGQSSAYYWSRLTASFVAQYPRRMWEFFTAVLRLGTKRWSALIDLDTNQERVLTSILRSDPERAWRCLADVYATAEEQCSSGIQYWLSEGGHRLPGNNKPGPIQFVPPSTLFAWVDQDVEDRAYWLIRALPKTMDASPGGRLTREFVARYGADEDCSRSLWSRFHSRGWCGPASDHYRALRNQAREWLVGERNQTVIR